METRPAGFWVRTGAFWIDALLVYSIVWAVVTSAQHWGEYVPFEATFLIVLVVQAIVLTAWLGATPGKLVCGLHVVRQGGASAGWLRALVRETLGKLVSLVVLGLGFLWIGWAPSKRGWHDYLAGTRVERSARLSPSHRLALVASFGTLLLAVGTLVVDWTSAVILFRQMAPRQVPSLAFERRDPETLVDVSSLAESDQGRFLDWMDREGRPPVDYVLDKARTHQVVVIGEIHEQRPLLEFLNELIPRLYHDAGVTRIAMEVCPAARNADLERLVTADSFDRELLLNIAREGGGGQMWGYQEYWDVLETVWKLNRSLAAGDPKMLVVGLSPEIDQPSLVMLGDPTVPWWEKLRMARVPREIDALATSDAFYARQVEQQIIEPGHRGIVWVGYAHSSLRVPSPLATSGQSYPRMGFMLHQKYGDKLFQIRMHAPMVSVADVSSSRSAQRAQLPAFLDRLLDKRDGEPVGFDVAESPFAPLRDKALWEDSTAPRLAFGDRTDGYVMLMRSDRLPKCRWIPGFITPQMFAQLKPYFQAMARREGGSVENAEQFNALFAESSDTPSE